jgi:hypothetical protein
MMPSVVLISRHSLFPTRSPDSALAPAKDIEYVAALALAWPVKPDKAKATYEHGLLRIEVPFKDPMEDAVKVAIKASSAENKTKKIELKT